MKHVKTKVLAALTAFLLTTACNKELKLNDQNTAKSLAANTSQGHLVQTKTFSAEAALKWMDMQLRLMRTAVGVPNVAFARPYAYTGITLYEAVVGGMPAYQSIAGQLNGLTDMPKTEPGKAYHWPSVANAALAFINKQMFPTASTANKAAIDSLENALNIQYANDADAETINRSIEYGKTVAQKVVDWAATDGYNHINDPYTPPTGPGLWVAPSLPLPAGSTPYWGNVRLMVAGSGDNAQPGAPTPYSEDPSSDFYKMVKQVYDASQSLTPAQKDMAMYWRDVPGVSTPGHYLSILKQVIENEGAGLDKAAYSYALCSIVVFDASVSCWKTKYQYTLVRPITYIRNVMGFTSWSPLLATPAHPEYSSAHAVLSSANADALTNIFGDNYSFTDHTYDYLGFPSRSFSSFKALGEDAGNSRLYAGIHYQPSINTGLNQGRIVAQNIISSLKFIKE